MPPDTHADGLRATSSAEHFSPGKSKKVTLRQLDPVTGDYVNLAAVDDGNGNYALATALSGFTPGTDFDYLDVQQTDSDTETYVFKTGGSGGTTVRTIVVNYTSSTKSDIDNVTWS